MTWADEQQVDESELIRLVISGRGDAWARLETKLLGLIDVIVDRVEGSASSTTATETTREVVKDISRIATEWARAKVERPTLENEKLRAEIASEFAEAKRRLAETLRIEAETRKIDAEARNIELVAWLDNLERLLRIAKLMAHATFARIGPDGHLLIGPRPEQLGDPQGNSHAIEYDR